MEQTAAYGLWPLVVINSLLFIAFAVAHPPTLVMFPVLVFMYVRLARREEREAVAEFGGAYDGSHEEKRPS